MQFALYLPQHGGGGGVLPTFASVGGWASSTGSSLRWHSKCSCTDFRLFAQTVLCIDSILSVIFFSIFERGREGSFILAIIMTFSNCTVCQPMLCGQSRMVYRQDILPTDTTPKAKLYMPIIPQAFADARYVNTYNF